MLEFIFQSWNNFTVLLLGFSIILWLLLRRPRGVPPGPPAYIPILGNLLDTDQRTVLETYRKYRQRYGDIFSLKMGTRLVIVVNGYDTLREIFVKNADVFSDRPDTFLFTKLERGYGITSASGEVWKAHRTFALTVLRTFGFGKRSLEPHIMKEVESVLNSLENSKRQPFDISAILQISIANIICALAFGERFDHDDEKLVKLLRLNNDIFKVNNQSGLFNFLPFLEYIPGDPFKAKRIINNREELEEFFIATVEEHKGTFDEQNIRDYTDAFIYEMKQNRQSNIFTDEHLLKTIYTFFAAGTETTVTTITWAVLFFLHHPQVQTKMRREIHELVGTTRRPGMEHRSVLLYCEAVITEVLRCGNIGPLALPHGVSKGTVFKGFKIPKEAIIIANLDSVMTDPCIFPNPDKFDPERYIGDDGKLSGTERVIAFSLGRRVCLAEALARMELFLFLTSMVQQFEFLPLEDCPLPSTEGIVGITRSPQPFLFRAIPV